MYHSGLLLSVAHCVSTKGDNAPMGFNGSHKANLHQVTKGTSDSHLFFRVYFQTRKGLQQTAIIFHPGHPGFIKDISVSLYRTLRLL